MKTAQPQAKTRLRDFASHDIPPLVAILNQVFADEPTTVEQQEHGERTYPAGNPRLRLVAETEEGQIAGYGESAHPQRHRQSGDSGPEREAGLSPAAGVVGVGENAVAQCSKPAIIALL